MHRTVFTHRTFTQKNLYTEQFLHTNDFTQNGFYTRRFNTQKTLQEHLLHREVFALRHKETLAHKRLCAQNLFYRYTQKLFQKNASTHTHRHLYAQMPFYTRTFLHTDAWFTYRRFHKENLLRTNVLTHRNFCAEKLLHKETYTKKRVGAQKKLHRMVFTRFKIAVLPHFFIFDHRFPRNGC